MRKFLTDKILNETNYFLLGILRMRTQDEELKKIVLKYLEDAKSFEYTKILLDDIRDEINLELKKFKHNKALQSILSMIYL